MEHAKVIIIRPEGEKLLWVSTQSVKDSENRVIECNINDLRRLRLLPEEDALKCGRGLEFIMWARGPWVGKALTEPVTLCWRINRDLTNGGSAPTAICRAWPDKLIRPTVEQQAKISVVGVHVLHNVMDLS